MKTKKVAFGVSEKPEIVQTRQQGLSLSNVGTMYGVHPTVIVAAIVNNQSPEKAASLTCP